MTYLGFPASTPAAQSIRAGEEIAPDFPREWYEFVDPSDPLHLFSMDVTWLSSHWECHFGTDICQGIDGKHHGCCLHGAYLTDEHDRDALTETCRALPASLWENRPKNLDDFFTDTATETLEPWLEWDELDGENGPEPALKTRVVKGTCIFANSESGCALHVFALSSGKSLIETKPEVCWMVPLRREEEWETRPDGVEIVHTKITEFDRRAWGSGGEDFTWWCTSAPQCHTASTPLWERYAPELHEMMGADAYEAFAQHMKHRDSCGIPLSAPHPAGIVHPHA